MAATEQSLPQRRYGHKPSAKGHVNGYSTTMAHSNSLSNESHKHEGTTQSTSSQSVSILEIKTVFPIFIMMAVPNVVMLTWYTNFHCDGSYLKLLQHFSEKSIISGFSDIWSLANYPSAPIVWILVLYCVYALAMMKILPGAEVKGPVTPKGNTPIYKDNGFTYYVVTLALFWVLTVVLHPFGLSPSILYDRFDEVLVTLNAFSLIFCLFLYLKGRISPSSTDSGSSGNFIFDYYWGMELYPRIFGFDIKVFTNCRFGMMVWALMVCVHAVKSYELYGFVDSMFVSVFLQLLYITKFFWWESGYLRTIDIMLDRAGFYICWGCLVFVPGFYTSVPLYLVSHPVHLGPAVSAIFLTLGALSIYINYAADNQKQEVRGTDGNCLIWGRKPELIRTKYQLENGEVRESILLASGWWAYHATFTMCLKLY